MLVGGGRTRHMAVLWVNLTKATTVFVCHGQGRRTAAASRVHEGAEEMALLVCPSIFSAAANADAKRVKTN